MKKMLFLTGNGLGDSVMLTPSFMKYEKEHPDTEIHIATLARFGQLSVDLFDGFGYTVHPILSDPWDIQFELGLRRLFSEGKWLAQDLNSDFRLCDSPRGPTDWKMHKIYRFAKYLHIDLVGNEFKTKLHSTLQGTLTNGIVVHITPGNEAKRLSKDMLTFVQSYCKDKHNQGFAIIEIGSDYIQSAEHIGIDDMKLTKALISCAAEVIAIDSVVMHIAGAFNKKLMSLWTATPIHQALPFWLPLDRLQVHAENERMTFSKHWKGHRKEAMEVLGCS